MLLLLYTNDQNCFYVYNIIYNYWLLRHWTWCDVNLRVPILTEAEPRSILVFSGRHHIISNVSIVKHSFLYHFSEQKSNNNEILAMDYYPGIQIRSPCTPGLFYIGAKLFIGTPLYAKRSCPTKIGMGYVNMHGFHGNPYYSREWG